MKKLRDFILKILARKVVAKYRPRVVGITGSVGKTSTKEAIFTVLAIKYRTHRAKKNLNSEAGVPLAAMTLDIWPMKKSDWVKAIVAGCGLLVRTKKDFPEALVIEYGADKPGDISYLLSIVQPTYVVVTAITPVHLVNYGSFEALEREKKTLLAAVDADHRFLNSDLVPRPPEAHTFGVMSGVVRTIERSVVFVPEKNHIETRFLVEIHGSRIPCTLMNTIGDGHVLACTAALSVGLEFGINPVDAIQALQTRYRGQPGRMRFLPGIKRTGIIDDTYNSSPEAVTMAVGVMRSLQGFTRQWAVLGEMRELGGFTEQLHREAGVRIVRSGIDFILTVGQAAHYFAHGAREAGMPSDHIFTFDDRVNAGKFLQHRIEKNDLILVKGSQLSFMETIVKEIMAEPERADELLVQRAPSVLRMMKN